jgi:nucleoside 2-deoxyribosyltransferase
MILGSHKITYQKMRIYFAGPLFTSAEREWNTRLVKLLRNAKLNIWLPQENEPTENTASGIFQMCKRGIDESDVVLAIMDGPDPDSGTCFECGYAYANKKPIFTIRTDFRKCGDALESRFNLMLTESSTVIDIQWDTTKFISPPIEDVALSIITALANHLR